MKQMCSTKTLSLLCLISTGLSISPVSLADFPDVRSMLESVRGGPSPAINNLIFALDGLPTEEQRFKAYSTLAPRTDLSLIVASETANRTLVKRINKRLVQLTPNGDETGYSAGDEWDDIFEDDDEDLDIDQGSTSEKPKAAKKPADGSKPETSPKPETKQGSEKETQKTQVSEVESEEEPTEEESTEYKWSFAENEDEDDSDDETIDKGVWLQVYASDTGHENRERIFGYDSRLLGGFLGRDWLLNPQTVLGVVAGYAQADVDSRGPSGSYMDIKRLSGSLYGYYNCPTGLYILGLLTLAHNDYDNNRKILVPPVSGVGFTGIAHADFTAWESHVHLELGYNWEKRNWVTQPKIFTNFTHLDVESYQEQDMGAYNLNVRNRTLNNFSVGAGFQTEYHNHFKRAMVAPFLHAYVLYDFMSDQQVTSSNLLGGGYSFLTQGANPGSTTFEVGGGLTVHSYKDVMFDVQYDFASRSSVTRHSLSIKVRHEWA